MGKIVILPEDCKSRACYLSANTLPAFYMEDFTIMGFKVDKYKDAVKLLQTSRFSLDISENGCDVTVDKPFNIREIQLLLLENGIVAQYTDIADTFYQA